MKKVFLVFGFPQIFHVAEGSEFTNEMVEKGCQEDNIQFLTIPLFRP